MDGFREVRLPVSRRNAYVKLTSTSTALVYIPGLNHAIGTTQFNFTRFRGAWILKAPDNVLAKLWWDVDRKDVYGLLPNSVESVLNEELSSLVNEAMFDESSRTEVPDL